jgi:hypothetical protein
MEPHAPNQAPDASQLPKATQVSRKARAWRPQHAHHEEALHQGAVVRQWGRQVHPRVSSKSSGPGSAFSIACLATLKEKPANTGWDS